MQMQARIYNVKTEVVKLQEVASDALYRVHLFSDITEKRGQTNSDCFEITPTVDSADAIKT